MAFRYFQKKNQSQEIWLVCSATTSIWALGWTFVVLGFQDGVQVLHFSLMPDTKQLVMTIQSSRCCYYDNSKYPFSSPLSLFLFFCPGFVHSTTVCHLLILAFIFALVELATTATRLLMFLSLFLFHTTDFSNTLLCLFFLLGFRFQQLPIILGRSQPSGVRFWSSLLIALALPTCMESQSSSLIQLRSGRLPLSFSLFVYLSICPRFSLCALRIVCCTLQVHHPCIALEVSASVFEAEYLTLFSRGWDENT
jgi:hypothetical protein